MKGQYNQDALNNQEALETALRAVTVRQNALYIYPTRSRADELITYVGNIIDDGLENLFQTIWSPLATLFSSGQGRRLLHGIVGDLATTNTANTRPRSIIAIDLSEDGKSTIFGQKISRKRLIKQLLDSLVRYASRELGLHESANVLVMIDEAGAFWLHLVV